MTTNPIGRMLSRGEVIEKLSELPDLPIVFMGQFGGFGMVRGINVVTVRKCKDGRLSAINEREVAQNHYGNGRRFRNWVLGENVKVIAIVGI